MFRLLRLRRALRTSSLAALALAWAVLPAHAQDAPPPDAQAPAHISFVDGAVILERDGTTDDSPASMPLVAGDRVRTRNGRAEILFADGSTLHLDNFTAIDLQSDDLVRLLEGRIRLSIPGPSRGVSYRIDAPHGWAHITEPGDYRLALMQSAGGGELEFSVIRGRAELANEGGRTPLRAGERAFVRAGAAPSEAYVANSSALDAFDRWSEARRDQRMAASAEYLPDEVRPYASTFEQYGYWRDEPTYGRVWYPRVALDWRPYYRGRWASLYPYGWTWIAYDPWGWPTHHYGRWGISTAGAWFWIPGRSWGAAWVSWAYAPGYVSWCPLGWNNRPIFQINVFNHRGYDPWRAWTVVPRNRFGHGFVHTNVVRVTHIDQRTLSAFTYRDRGPDVQGFSGARRPIRLAGTGSIRSGTPLYTNRPVDGGRIDRDNNTVRIPDGARPSPSNRGVTAVPRERSIPSRPAVRSERGPVDVRPGDASAAARDDVRREPLAGARPRRDGGEVAPRMGGDTSSRSPQAVRRYEAAPDRAPSPREIDRAPAPSRRTEIPGARGIESPAPRRMETPAPRRDDQPAYERPSGARPSRSYGIDRDTRSAEPPARAVPRGPEPSRRMDAPPAPERRAPDRAPSGSIQRGPAPSARPGGAPPAAQSGGGRPSGPPPGARPRGGGRGGH
jgi:hypothetical protein